MPTDIKFRPASDDERRHRLANICLALPEVTCEGDQHVAFRVRGRTFAYYLQDHHGDGRLALTCKAGAGENAALVASDPARFFIPPYVGPRGWIGLRLDLLDVDWEEVAELILDSYRLTAPKGLVNRAERPVAEP